MSNNSHQDKEEVQLASLVGSARHDVTEGNPGVEAVGSSDMIAQVIQHDVLVVLRKGT